jgi:hypothetical protein
MVFKVAAAPQKLAGIRDDQYGANNSTYRVCNQRRWLIFALFPK